MLQICSVSSSKRVQKGNVLGVDLLPVWAAYTQYTVNAVSTLLKNG